MLQVSSYVGAAEPEVVVDLAPGARVFDPGDVTRTPRGAEAAVGVLRAVLPGRLAERWVAENAAHMARIEIAGGFRFARMA